MADISEITGKLYRLEWAGKVEEVRRGWGKEREKGKRKSRTRLHQVVSVARAAELVQLIAIVKEGREIGRDTETR